MNEVRLLLADKNLSYLEIARKMLRFHDEAYQVDVALTGQECLEKLNKNHYDLLLLDYDIDDKKGLEVLSRIVDRKIDVPVVMLVDEGREEIAHKALEKGAYDYIMKVRGYLTALPFTVGKVLEKKRQRIITPVLEQQPVEEGPGPQYVEASEELPCDDTPGHLIDTDSLPDLEVEDREAYFILDHKGRFITTNPKLEEMLKYSEEELLELNLSDLIPAQKENEYYRWLTQVDLSSQEQSFRTELVGKYGDQQLAEIILSPMRDRDNEVISYKGKIKIIVPDNGSAHPSHGDFDQAKMINEMVQLIHDSYNLSFNHLIERITHLVCQLFQFKRATLALLDRRRKTFVKQIMIGYSNGKPDGERVLEVPQEVIDKIFFNQSKIKVIYHDHESGNNNGLSTVISERRSQPRRASNQWHPQDMIIFNLVDHQNRTFGYISLDEPLYPVVPPHEFFYNMELFSSLTSLAIENFYNFAALEKRNRRLKQLLLSSNLFRLHLSISEMIHEIVWAIKFAMNYNLVLLGFINRNSKQFQIKSVACDDRIKTLQLKEITIPVSELQSLFKNEYRRGKSYLITRSEPALRRIKALYYDRKIDTNSHRYWNWYVMLIIPIYGSNGKMIGYIMVDDPMDCMLPASEDIHTLEILANQVSVAIENRLSYVRLRDQVMISKGKEPRASAPKEKTEGGIKKLVDRFFK